MNALWGAGMKSRCSRRNDSSAPEIDIATQYILECCRKLLMVHCQHIQFMHKRPLKTHHKLENLATIENTMKLPVCFTPRKASIVCIVHDWAALAPGRSDGFESSSPTHNFAYFDVSELSLSLSLSCVHEVDLPSKTTPPSILAYPQR